MPQRMFPRPLQQVGKRARGIGDAESGGQRAAAC